MNKRNIVRRRVNFWMRDQKIKKNEMNAYDFAHHRKKVAEPFALCNISLISIFFSFCEIQNSHEN